MQCLGCGFSRSQESGQALYCPDMLTNSRSRSNTEESRRQLEVGRFHAGSGLQAVHDEVYMTPASFIRGLHGPSMRLLAQKLPPTSNSLQNREPLETSQVPARARSSKVVLLALRAAAQVGGVAEAELNVALVANHILPQPS